MDIEGPMQNVRKTRGHQEKMTHICVLLIEFRFCSRVNDCDCWHLPRLRNFNSNSCKMGEDCPLAERRQNSVQHACVLFSTRLDLEPNRTCQVSHAQLTENNGTVRMQQRKCARYIDREYWVECLTLSLGWRSFECQPNGS